MLCLEASLFPKVGFKARATEQHADQLTAFPPVNPGTDTGPGFYVLSIIVKELVLY